MRLLLTGAAGFLGSHLADRFLAEGHEVVGMDNFLTGAPGNIAHLRDHPRFAFLEHDVTRTIAVPGCPICALGLRVCEHTVISTANEILFVRPRAPGYPREVKTKNQKQLLCYFDSAEQVIGSCVVA